MLKIYFLYRNFTFNTGTKPTEKSPKRFKKTYSGACVRVLNSDFWQKYFHKSISLLHLVPRTDVPEKKKIWTVSGVLQAGSSGNSIKNLNNFLFFFNKPFTIISFGPKMFVVIFLNTKIKIYYIIWMIFYF